VEREQLTLGVRSAQVLVDREAQMDANSGSVWRRGEIARVIAGLDRVLSVPGLEPDDARRRRLLNVMLLSVGVVALLMSVALLVTVPFGRAGTRGEVLSLGVATVAALFGVAGVYALNRRVSGTLASVLFLVFLIVVTAVSDEPRQVVDGRGLFVFAIPIIAASILLRPWASYVTAGLSALVNIVIAISMLHTTPNIPAVLSFFVLATVSWLSARTLEGALVRLRVANHALRESELRLEETVEMRTRELYQAQAQLVHREGLAVLGQLADGMAHELRNPLGVISNAIYYLGIVLADADEDIREAMDTVSVGIEDAVEIVSGLSDLAHPRPAVRETVSVSALVERALMRHPVPDDVHVVSRLDVPVVFVDSGQIVEALSRMMMNAYQAMPAGGTLTLSAQVDGGGVVVSISDTGHGIAAKDLDRIFEPLYTTKARGIGLGLALARSWIEVNGGSIRAESSVGVGSTVTVTLPLWQNSGEQ
jgi:two-component system, NtrC family, sensor histidine kinase HydH